MDKIKKVYIDSRYKTSDSYSDSEFNIELKEAIDLPDNTVCYVDDISIPHTWYTVEHYNNRLYVQHSNTTTGGNDYFILQIPFGNYNGASLASEFQTQLQRLNPNFNVVYNTGRGTMTITLNQAFKFVTDTEIKTTFVSVAWRNLNNDQVLVDFDYLMSINDVIRNNIIRWDLSNTFETGFLDLVTTHNIYLHCPNLGHYNCIGVRGENSIIKKIPVSSSFGYVIIDSVVAPHDKIDVSNQTIKTLSFTLKDVHGNIIDLHGAFVSFSLIFQTIE